MSRTYRKVRVLVEGLKVWEDLAWDVDYSVPGVVVVHTRGGRRHIFGTAKLMAIDVLEAPPVRVIDLEGLKLYLSRSTAGGTEKGEKLYRLLRDEAIHAGAEPGINEEAVEVLVQKAQAFLDALTTIEKSAMSQYIELQQALERIREGRAA